MSRLLHRLAVRSRGGAPEIRPIVRWNAPSGHADSAPRMPDSQPIEPAASAVASPAPALRAPPAAASHIAFGPREVAATVAPVRPAPDAWARDAGGAQRLDEPSAPVASVAGVHAASTPLLDSAFAVAPVSLASDAEQPRGATAADTPTLQQRPTHPEPLLAPPRPAPSSAGPRDPGARRAARAPTDAAEAVTEVHVTIGRIELTAVQEAPRPRREPARARGPESLDEYLARREAKRR